MTQSPCKLPEKNGRVWGARPTHVHFFRNPSSSQMPGVFPGAQTAGAFREACKGVLPAKLKVVDAERTSRRERTKMDEGVSRNNGDLYVR